MKIRKVALLLLIMIVGFVSCKKDDDTTEVVEIELNDRTEQQEVDIDSINIYLNNHYYNSGDFDETNLDPSIKDLVISELLEGETEAPADHTLLIDELISTENPEGKLELHTAVFEETDYEYYILRLNQGDGSSSPTFADSVDILYEGFTLDGEVFDSKVFWDGIPRDLSGSIKGWRLVMPMFKTAETFIENGDGTIEYTNHGTGVMFIPSGLGYFSDYINSDIGQYRCLIFKFDLLQVIENDHDNDGVSSFDEDLNGDGEYTVNFDDLEDTTDDDTDGDGTPDYFDSDDDGDGVLTINEDIDGDGDPTNDIGANGIPKYLDATETESL